jgi:hypothetical protein
MTDEERELDFELESAKLSELLNPRDVLGSDLKRKVVNKLTKELEDNEKFMEYVNREGGDAKDIINEWVAGWADTSGDKCEYAVAMQLAADNLFGTAGNTSIGHFTQELIRAADKIYHRDGEAMKAFLQAQYNTTQKFFEKNGITEVIAYRGAAFNEEDTKFLPKNINFDTPGILQVVGIQLQPLSSFSTDIDTAQNFCIDGEYKMVTQMKIPVKRILSTPHTGFGCMEETELVVIGGEFDQKVIAEKSEFGDAMEVDYDSFETK